MTQYRSAFSGGRIEHLVAGVVCLAMAAILVSVPATRRWVGALSRAVVHMPLPAYAVMVAATAIALGLWWSTHLFHGTPYIDDGLAALFQAKLFALGRLTEVAPQPYASFDIFGIVATQGDPVHWVGMYPPGWPALLTVGVWLGAVHWVNPALNGLLAVFTCLAATALFDRRVGRLAGVLVAVSPFLTVVSATYLAHTATALFCVIAWWGGLRLMASGRVRFGLLVGLAVGAAFLCRPVTALVVAAVLGAGLLAWTPSRTVAVRGALLATLGFLPAVGILMGFQFLISGNATLPGHVAQMGEQASLGFDVADHSPANGIRHTKYRLAVLAGPLLGWGFPSFAFILMPFFTRRATGKDVWLLLPLLGVAAVFSTFWYFEAHMPGRYLIATSPFLVILAARGWVLLHDVLGSRPRFPLAPAILCFAFLYLAVIGARDYGAFFGPPLGDNERTLPTLVKDLALDNVLILHADIHPEFPPPLCANDTFASGFMLNTDFDAGPIIVARNIPASRLLLERHPDRDVYVYEYDCETTTGTLFQRVLRNGVVQYDPVPAPGAWAVPRTDLRWAD